MGEASILRSDNSLFCSQRMTDIAVLKCREFQLKGTCDCPPGRTARDEYAERMSGMEEVETMEKEKGGLCTICGEGEVPSNWSTGVCRKCAMARNTKKRDEIFSKKQPATGSPVPEPPSPGSEPPTKKPSPKNNGRPVTLTTIHSDDLDGDPVETMRQAQGWVDRLAAAEIPTILEVVIRIIPEEGRGQ